MLFGYGSASFGLLKPYFWCSGVLAPGSQAFGL